jgi:signal-transduction protein with cAMP-binding, CBS, and nucleotidyltransferase domain
MGAFMKTAEQMINEKGNHLISVSPNTSIYDALRLMIEKQIGAILVKKGDEIVGIWTERDLMRNTVTAGFDAQKAKIGDYMTTGLKSAPASDTVYMLKDKFLGLKLRHLLIEKEGKYIGLLSIGDVIKASIQEKDQELKNLNAMVSWEYYENWRWKP